MANQEYLDMLKQGVEIWNQWRKEHADIQPDLSEADHFIRADLRYANFSKADLHSADLSGADLRYTNLTEANLIGADLRYSDLSKADLSKANLSQADLSRAAFVQTKLHNATLAHCRVYGILVWDVDVVDTDQSDLLITDFSSHEPTIFVDNLKIAQFIYLLLHNAKIRDVIDTVARKAVLILGRFTLERKAVLDALREVLRTYGYVPILFDFEWPDCRNVTETMKILAHLSRFIIADLTDPSSIPYELAQVVPGLAVPIQPILLEGKRAFAMFSGSYTTLVNPPACSAVLLVSRLPPTA